MATATITIEESLLRELEEIARWHETSVEAFVSEAVREKLAQSKPDARPRPKPTSIGSGASGYHDTARLSGEIRPEPRSWR
jgi:hypothetical protein